MFLSAVLDQVLIISFPDYCQLFYNLSHPPGSVVFVKYDNITSQLKTGLWFPYPSKKINWIHYCGTNVFSCSCLLIYAMGSAGVKYDMWYLVSRAVKLAFIYLFFYHHIKGVGGQNTKLRNWSRWPRRPCSWLWDPLDGHTSTRWLAKKFAHLEHWNRVKREH